MWDGGQTVDDPEVLARIKALVIPPAWTDVWICPWPNGHIQALGTDAAGRRQYRYHDKWRELRDEEKFQRLLEFGHLLPGFRKAYGSDLEGTGVHRERVLAAAVRLLDIASLRIGGEEYANDNETYGLATLLKTHARVNGESATFTFTAKSNQELCVHVTDRESVDVLRALKNRRGGGPELLAWKERSRWRDVRSDDINAYIKEGIGERFSAKDFRTWNATVLAAVYLADAGRSKSELERRRIVTGAVKHVAEHLGNTPAVCRKSYIDPRAIDFFHRGDVAVLPSPKSRKRAGLERAVLALLEESRGGRQRRSLWETAARAA